MAKFTFTWHQLVKKNTSPHTEEGWELHLLLVEYSLVAGDLNLLNVRQTDSLDRLLRLVIGQSG